MVFLGCRVHQRIYAALLADAKDILEKSNGLVDVSVACSCQTDSLIPASRQTDYMPFALLIR